MLIKYNKRNYELKLGVIAKVLQFMVNDIV